MFNKKNCYPEEEIDKKLKVVNLNTNFFDHDIKLDDLNEPFKLFSHNDMSMLTSSLFKTQYRELSEARVYSDKNLIFGSYEEKKSYRLTQVREEVDLRTNYDIVPGTFSQMYFVANGNTQIYYRNYTKLFSIIVKIGGFFNGTIYTVTLILYIYSNNMILWHCILNTISEDELEERLKIIRLDVKDDSNNDLNIRPSIVNINRSNQEEENSNNSNQNNERNNNIPNDQLRLGQNSNEK